MDNGWGSLNAWKYQNIGNMEEEKGSSTDRSA